MTNEQTNKIIDIIKTMDEKDRLRLAICVNESVYTNISYNKNEMVEKFDKWLKEIDEEYRTTIVNMAKYKNVLLTTASVTELAI